MDNEAITDLFSGLGTVSIRKMFGGKGIYFDGVIIGVELRDELMLKADDESEAAFIDAGCRQWVYTHNKSNKPVAMPYWSIPDSAFDDPDEMAGWARRAFEAGSRAARK